jgi:membrane protein DedA with SNARE-associated domain
MGFAHLDISYLKLLPAFLYASYEEYVTFLLSPDEYLLLAAGLVLSGLFDLCTERCAKDLRAVCDLSE